MSLTRWSDASLQWLTSGHRCEEPGCYEQACWFVTLAEFSGHWCPVHTVDHMGDAEYWEIYTARSEISMRAEGLSRDRRPNMVL